MSETFTCSDCGAIKPINKEGGTGYAIVRDTPADPNTERKICYVCCGERDKKEMIEEGKAILYWDGKKVSNWPGTLTFAPTRSSKGHHNIGRTREDVWFTGPDNKSWHGVQIGENTQILRCKRLKG
jgi:hypothetical protein